MLIQKVLIGRKYQNANLITPNIKEAEIILGEKLETDEDFEMAGKKICSTFDIEACLITRGGDGMSFYCKNNTFHLKSNAKEIFDVSGAGDTVISTMATGLVMDLSYKQAVRIFKSGSWNCSWAYWYFSYNNKRIIKSQLNAET